MNTSRGFAKWIFWLFLATVTTLPLLFVPQADVVFELPKVIFFRLAVFVIVILMVTSIKQPIKVLAGSELGRMFWIPFAVFLLAAALSTSLSSSPYISFFGSYMRQQGFLQIFFYATFFVCAVLFFKNEKGEFGIEKFLKFLCLGVALVSFFAIIQKLSGQVEYRVFSTIGHPNFLGSYLVVGTPFLFILIKRTKFLEKTIWRTVLAMAIISLFLTFSRASILALLLELIMLTLLSGHVFLKSIKKELLAVFCAVCIFGGASFFAEDGTAISRISGKGEGGTSIEMRLEIWRLAGKSILEKPFFGHGPEMFQIKISTYGGGDILIDRAHNEELDLLFNFGIIGFIAYEFMFFAVLMIGFRGRKNELVAASMTGVGGLFIANMFGFSTTVHNVIFCLLIAFIIVLSSTKKPS